MNETVLPASFAPRVPIVGTLKIGDVIGGKVSKLEYMRLCTASATGDNRYEDHPDFKEFNDGKNKSINIELVSDEPRVNLDIVYNMGGNGFIVCRGDGTNASRRIGPDGKISTDAAFQKLPEGTCGEGCPFAQSGKCKLASTLYFRIPGRTAIGSVWQFRTKAINSAQDLLGAMHALKAITGGVLARIPLKIFMTEQKRRPVTDKGRTTSHFWTLGIAFDGDEEELIQAVAKARKLARDMAELSMPSLEQRLKDQPSDLLEDMDEAEERAYAAEFWPVDIERVPDPETPRSQFESPEWTKEERAQAKQSLQDFGEHLYNLGLEKDKVEKELEAPRNLLGDLSISFNTWGNRLSGRWERVTKRVQKERVEAF